MLLGLLWLVVNYLAVYIVLLGAVLNMQLASMGKDGPTDATS